MDRLVLIAAVAKNPADPITGINVPSGTCTQIDSAGFVFRLFAWPVPDALSGSQTLSAVIASTYGQALIMWELAGGTDPAGRYGTVFSASGSSNAPSSGSQTCPANGYLFGAMWHNYSAGAASTTAGTSRGNGYEGGGSRLYSAAYRTSTGALTWSTTDASTWGVLGVPILGAASGTPVGIATETDIALALAGKQIRALGLATETDTALALTSAAGLPFNTAPYEFGQRTGLDVADFSLYASTALNVSVYAATDVLLTTQLFAYTESTGSDGRLTRKTHTSLVAGTTYIFVAVTAGGALVAAGRIQAT